MTQDTIAAIATAPGAAGLAVVRVSGAEALVIADRVFRGAKPLAAADGHTLHHGWAVWPEGTAPERLDETVAAVFRAPASYTREHIVEFSCHGGRLPAERVLEALLAAGARLAGPGEFTLRAFLHGRIDLAQAEAVADLIHAESEGARALAVQQLAGALSARIDALTERLSDAVAEVEARVDFADDVGGIEVPPHVVEAIAAVDRDLADLLAGAAWGRAVRDGVRIPIVGRPNVGKSSLFNALVGEERAIVTPRPGTTRDRVSETIELSGVRVTFSDTAGMRDAEDAVEAIGVARAQDALAHATLVLWVVDGAAPLTVEDRAIAVRLAGKDVVLAINKRDAGAEVSADAAHALLAEAAGDVVETSAATGDGLDALRAVLVRRMGAAPVGLVAANGGTDAGGVAVATPARTRALGAAVANPRHAEALQRARGALERATRAAHDGLPGELVALELREGLSAIGEVTGRDVGEDLLDRIFSRFCIGK